MSLHETVARLRALADRGATDSERATAADILAKLRAKHGADYDALAAEAEGSVDIKHSTPTARRCVMHVAQYLGLQPFWVLSARGRKLGGVTRLKGPQHLVELAPGLVARFVKRAERVASLAEMAFFLGGMPLPVTPPSPPRIGPNPAPPEPTISAEDRAMIQAAARAGRSAAEEREALPERV